MAFNYDTLIVDRPLRFTLFDKTSGLLKFTADQIMEPSLNVAGTQVFVTNGIGSRIATFDREKTAKFTARNSQISLGLFAAQTGKTKQLASVANPIIVPKCEILTVGFSAGTTVNTTLTLSEVPVGTAGSEIAYIYRLNRDQSVAETFTVDDVASATTFTVTAASKLVTLPTIAGDGAIAETDQFAIYYNYSATSGVRIDNDGDKFATGGKGDLEVIFADYIDPNIKYYGHVIFPSIKMDPNFDIAFTTEGNHAFGFESMIDNGSTDKNMFHFIIA